MIKNVPLKFPTWFGIQTRKKEVVPIECCTVVPNQQYRRQLTPAETAKVIKVATKKPEARFKAIDSGVEVCSWLSSFNIYC